jgi:hypothetical protein
MNLPGPHQRLVLRCEAQGGGAMPQVAFRSRPIWAQRNLPGAVSAGQVAAMQRGNWRCEETPGWSASVWDELRADADGAVTRRIKILITDGPQPEPEELA